MAVPIQYERNLGFFNEAEQHALGSAVVSIGGAGGDGGMLALQLARLGVGSEGGEIRLADPDPFEAENINRQAACTVETIGVNKAVAVGAAVQAINPDIRVTTFTEGVTSENVNTFVAGANLLLDETEFTMHGIGVALARAARENNIPNLHALNVGFGTQITSYDPRSKYTLERRLGLSETAPLEEVSAAEVGIDKWLAWMPPYADLEVFKKVTAGEKSAPSVAPGVAIAAGVAAVEAALHLIGTDNNRPSPTIFPHTKVVDAMTGTAMIVKHPKASFIASFLRMKWRSEHGRNPSAGY